MSDPLRFVIQHHVREPDPHYDLMLERDGALTTFRLVALPTPGRQEATLLQEHRLDYLTYEGEISGGRGTVALQDRGIYRAELWEESRMVVDLDGERHAGRAAFDHVTGTRWIMEWIPRGA